MPPRTEMLRDSAIGREKALGVSWRFEPLHAPLPLPGGLMRVLGAVVKIAMLTMFYTWQDLALSRSVTLQLIGDDHARAVGQAFQEFTKELLRGLLIPVSMDEDISHVPVLIHG